MPIFGQALVDPGWKLRKRLYYRAFGVPFAWKKPSLVLCAMDIESNDKVLDVGCRDGEYVAEYAARGATAVGLDINAQVIGTAVPRSARQSETRGVSLTLGSAYELPFRDGAFNKASICDCLEHLEHDVTALREIRRVLRGDGAERFVVTVPTIPGYPPHRVFARLISLVPKSRLLKGNADEKGKTLQISEGGSGDGIVLAHASSSDILQAFGHYRHYDEASLRSALESAGFRVLRMQRFQKLFESEMIYFVMSVRGFQRPLLYPILRAIAALDAFLPRRYPGVGLLAVCEKAT